MAETWILDFTAGCMAMSIVLLWLPRVILGDVSQRWLGPKRTSFAGGHDGGGRIERIQDLPQILRDHRTTTGIDRLENAGK